MFFLNWNARNLRQQNPKYNCPRSQRCQTKVAWILKISVCVPVTAIHYFSNPYLISPIYPHTIDKLLFGWPATYTVLIGTKLIYLTAIWKQSEFHFPIQPEIFFPKALKSKLLSKLLRKIVYNLEDLNRPRISEIISKEQISSCYLHSNSRPANDQLTNHCAEPKARIFSQWTQSDAQRRHGNFNTLSVSQLECIHLLDSTWRSAYSNIQQNSGSLYANTE